jgi:hypothetical protein
MYGLTSLGSFLVFSSLSLGKLLPLLGDHLDDLSHSDARVLRLYRTALLNNLKYQNPSSAVEWKVLTSFPKST